MPIATTTFAVPNVSGDFTVAHGLNETPKALIFLCAGTNTALGSWAVNGVMTVGFWTPGDGAKSVGVAGLDAQATSSEVRILRSSAIATYAGTSRNGDFTVSSVDATNIVMNFAFIPGNPGALIGVLAIAGPNVQAKIVTDTMNTLIATKAKTGVGFQPDCVLFAHAGSAAITEDTTTTDMRFGFGAMTSVGAGIGMASQNGVTTTASGRRLQGPIISAGFGGTNIGSAGLFSMDADGYTLNWSTAAAAAAPFYALCLKGVKAGLLAFNKRSGTGTQSLTGFGFSPQAAIFFSASVAGNFTQTTALASIGAASFDGGKYTVGVQSRNGLGTSDDNSYANAKAVMQVGGIATTIGEADVSAWGTDGLTLNWTTSDTTTTPFDALCLSAPDFAQPASISTASSTSATGKKNGASSPSISATTSTSATGKKIGSGPCAISTTTSTASTGTKKAAGTSSISTASSAAATGTKQVAGTSSISTVTSSSGSGEKIESGQSLIAQPSTLTVVGKKATSGTSAITVATSATATGAKAISSAASISTVSSTAAIEKKNGRGSSSITDPSSASATGTRTTSGVPSITTTTGVSANEIKHAFGTALIDVPDVFIDTFLDIFGENIPVVATGEKGAASPASVTTATSINATGAQSESGIAEIATATSISATGKKQTKGTAAVSSATSTDAADEKNADATVAISAAITTFATDEKRSSRPAAITDATSTSIDGTKHANQTVVASASSSVDASGQRSEAGQALITQPVVATEHGSKSVAHAVSLSVGVSVAAVGKRSITGTAAISVQTAISATGQKTPRVHTVIVIPSAVAANGTKNIAGHGTIVTIPSVRATGTKQGFGSSTIFVLIAFIVRALRNFDRCPTLPGTPAACTTSPGAPDRASVPSGTSDRHSVPVGASSRQTTLPGTLNRCS